MNGFLKVIPGHGMCFELEGASYMNLQTQKGIFNQKECLVRRNSQSQKGFLNSIGFHKEAYGLNAVSSSSECLKGTHRFRMGFLNQKGFLKGTHRLRMCFLNQKGFPKGIHRLSYSCTPKDEYKKNMTSRRLHHSCLLLVDRTCDDL